MYDTVAKSTMGICLPCFNDDWDSQLGPCSATEIAIWRCILEGKWRHSDVAADPNVDGFEGARRRSDVADPNLGRGGDGIGEWERV
jgi:hypothetical protein